MGCCCCKDSHASYEVSLAGTDIVNGTYAYDKEYKGKGLYTNEQTGFSIWYNQGEWRIGKTNDYYYVNKSDDENPPITGWILPVDDNDYNKAAVEPTPTVSKNLLS